MDRPPIVGGPTTLLYKTEDDDTRTDKPAGLRQPLSLFLSLFLALCGVVDEQFRSQALVDDLLDELRQHLLERWLWLASLGWLP